MAELAQLARTIRGTSSRGRRAPSQLRYMAFLSYSHKDSEIAAWLHDELEEFVAAGLSPFQALEGATTNAAKFLGREDIGRAAVGAQADLLLLRRNPLADIRVTHEIDGVVLRGAWRPL